MKKMKQTTFLWGIALSSILISCSNGSTNSSEHVENLVTNEDVLEQNSEDNSDATVQEEALMQTNTASLLTELLIRLENQEKVDAQIQAEVESGYYTPENPLIILDPYTQSPLTALICFTTEEPGRVAIHIEGEDEYTEVNHNFSEFTTQHIIPVYGLYPDKRNPITVMVYDGNGEEVARNISVIQTEPVSDHFQSLIILAETFQEGYQKGINYLYHAGKSAFDKNGDFRWYFSDITYTIVGELDYLNRRFIMTQGQEEKHGDTFLFELDKLGKIYAVYYSPYGVHHEISYQPDGTLLLGGSNEWTHSDAMYEIDIITGEVKNFTDFRTILQRSRPAWTFNLIGVSNESDWMHLNSIEYDDLDDSVLISSNYQSAVFKMDWPSGEINWILGNHDHWTPRLEQYLLTPIGNDFEWQYNQHAAMFLPDYDNNPDTVDILLFDNGTTRFEQNLELQRQILNHEIVAPEKYSRLVHYRINEITMEVEQIWQYGKERGIELFSTSTGDADLLPNGNILGMFQHNFPIEETNSQSSHPVLSEVNSERGLVWEAEVFKNTAQGNKDEYRAERLPFYFDDDAEHDIYSTARNLIPDEVMVSALGSEYLINSGKMELKELFSHDSVFADRTPDNLLIYREEFEISGNSYYQLDFTLSEQDILSIDFINIDLYDGPDYDFSVNEVCVDNISERIDVLLSSTDIAGVSDGTAEIRVMITVNGEHESVTLTDLTFGKYE